MRSVFEIKTTGMTYEQFQQTLVGTTLFAHANAFPQMWAGIWSGADGYFGPSGGAAPGAPWASEVTPMTDFPTLNNNQHALPLLAALRRRRRRRSHATCLRSWRRMAFASSACDHMAFRRRRPCEASSRSRRRA